MRRVVFLDENRTFPALPSRAFKEIFGVGKTEYAIKITNYYIQNKANHPLEDIIRKLYNNDIGGINFN